MIVLYILLGLIALIVLLFSVKISVELAYEDTFEVWLQVLFIKYRLLPGHEKKKAKKEKKPEEEKPEEEKPPEEPKEEGGQGDNFVVKFYKEQGFDGTIRFIGDVLRALNTMLGDVFKRSFVVEKLFLRLVVTKPDAAETALAYGKTCAAVYPALGYICSQLIVRKYDADIRPDYLAKESTAAMRFRISLRPIKITNALVRFAFRAVIAFLKAKRRASVRKKTQTLPIERNEDA